MRRLLLAGAIAIAALVPASSALAASGGVLKGTVVGKDRARHALVVARPGGGVQTIVAPKAFARTTIGHAVAIRFATKPGQLPLALGVTLRGHAGTALVRGTIVRLVQRRAVVNAGGSLLRVKLPARTGLRTLSSAGSGVTVGDTVEIEVEIDDHGGLDATTVTTSGITSPAGASAGELEVRGTVTDVTAATASAAGSITVSAAGLSITCAVPPGATLAVKVGDAVELKCDLLGNPGVWTLRLAKGEDDETGDDDGGQGGSAPGAASPPTEVEVRGIVAAPFDATSTSITVTPTTGAPVTCAVTAGLLKGFTAGDLVKMECKTVGGVLALKEIEKQSSDGGGQAGNGGSGSNDDGDDNGDDNGGDGHSGSGGDGHDGGSGGGGDD